MKSDADVEVLADTQSLPLHLFFPLILQCCICLLIFVWNWIAKTEASWGLKLLLSYNRQICSRTIRFIAAGGCRYHSKQDKFVELIATEIYETPRIQSLIQDVSKPQTAGILWWRTGYWTPFLFVTPPFTPHAIHPQWQDLRLHRSKVRAGTAGSDDGFLASILKELVL